MDLAALTMLVFGVIIIVSGMAGLVMPQLLLHMLGLPAGGATPIFVMATSQASLAMGLYYLLVAANNDRMFMRWSVPLRLINFSVFATMILFGVAPLQWSLVAALELVGALATGNALRFGRTFRWHSFDACRIASVVLGAAGGALAFQPFGIYGSASAFLAISSAGFMYAYSRLAPVQP